MHSKHYRVFFFLIALLPTEVFSQQFMISQVYVKTVDSTAIYSITIKNNSRDSILVLHTQEAEFPPFINHYKYDLPSSAQPFILRLGKSNNPFLPERYRATKTMSPSSSIELYFYIPIQYCNQRKLLEIWYSCLDQKFLGDFKKLEITPSQSCVAKCKKLKEKYGIVHHKTMEF
ncbi:hypothetical protein BH11BAC2_BH11BAC2_12810 [soil metagenome]